MKHSIYCLLLFFIMSCNNEKLQLIEDEELIYRIVNQEMPDPENLTILHAEGGEISLDSLKKLESTGEYFEDFYVNAKNEIVQLVVRKTTPKDEELFAKINQQLEGPEELKTVEIDCADKANILQKVYDRDQGMRTGSMPFDPDIDHENLEIVVSFIEQCGMPTLQEVSKQQLAAVWLSLQHAPPTYQKMYIPLIEKSAKAGDLEWSVVALMKDRALLHEGQPQIYGSQVVNGELYDLMEPEYVDQRRAEVGLGPLKEYLKNFDVAFEVDQKEKN